MDFHNRQYDPQIGRFLGVDPLAVATKSFSSYAAMNNNPASTVDPLGLTGIRIISWVGYAPTRMDQLLMMAPSELMDQLGMTDELRNYNEQMVAAAQEREQARETKQQAATQARTGQSPFSSGNTACNKFLTDGPSANEVYGVGGGDSDGDGDDGKCKGCPVGPFSTDEDMVSENKAESVGSTESGSTWDPVTDKRISQLDDRLKGPATNFVNAVEAELGIQLRIVQGYRSIAEQDALYAQGRTKPGGKVTNA